MSGAYTAKPPLPVTVPAWPTIPYGWNPDWSWPGPNPPGYVIPETSLNLASGSEISLGGNVSAAATWHDATFGGPAGMPEGNWQQRWTATIGGAAIGLRALGDPEFSNALVYEFTEVEGYYGAEDNLEFDIAQEDIDKVITLTVESEVDGETYTDTAQITVVGGSYARVYFVGSTGPDSWSSVTASDGSVLKIQSSGLTYEVASQTGIFSDMALQLGTPHVTYGVVHSWSFYIQLTPVQWAAWDGQTLTIETYFSENFPEGYYNGIHDTYLRIRVYDDNDVQAQLAQKDNDLVIGEGVTIGSGPVPAMSIDGDTITLL